MWQLFFQISKTYRCFIIFFNFPLINDLKHSNSIIKRYWGTRNYLPTIFIWIIEKINDRDRFMSGSQKMFVMSFYFPIFQQIELLD